MNQRSSQRPSTSTPSAAPSHPVLSDTRTVNLQESIANQAYTLWQKYGEPADRSLAIWLEAEKQVLGSDASINRQATGAVSAARLNEVTAPPPRSFDSAKADGSQASAKSKL